jgi:hypothetical protein
MGISGRLTASTIANLRAVTLDCSSATNYATVGKLRPVALDCSSAALDLLRHSDVRVMWSNRPWRLPAVSKSSPYTTPMFPAVNAVSASPAGAWPGSCMRTRGSFVKEPAEKESCGALAFFADVVSQP